MRGAPEQLLRPGERVLPPVAQLHIGDYRVSAAPEVLYTLLGSCVAVCLFDAAAGVGGMNHILLPGRAGDKRRFEEVARFGHDAVEMLVKAMVAAGAQRRRLAAKVFGGGHIIRQMDEGSSPGYRNVEFVLELMAEERIPIVTSDLAGYQARRVWFRTDTAEVLLKRLPAQLTGGVGREEVSFRRSVLRELRASREPESAAPRVLHKRRD